MEANYKTCEATLTVRESYLLGVESPVEMDRITEAQIGSNIQAAEEEIVALSSLTTLDADQAEALEIKQDEQNHRRYFARLFSNEVRVVELKKGLDQLPTAFRD